MRDQNIIVITDKTDLRELVAYTGSTGSPQVSVGESLTL